MHHEEKKHPLNRQMLETLIGEKIDVDGKKGVIVIDVGLKFMHVKFPSSQETEMLDIGEIGKVWWEERIRHTYAPPKSPTKSLGDWAQMVCETAVKFGVTNEAFPANSRELLVKKADEICKLGQDAKRSGVQSLATNVIVALHETRPAR